MGSRFARLHARTRCRSQARQGNPLARGCGERKVGRIWQAGSPGWQKSPSALLPVQGLGLVPLPRGPVLNEEPPQATSAPRRRGMVLVLVYEGTQQSASPCVCAKPCVLLPERGRADFLPHSSCPGHSLKHSRGSSPQCSERAPPSRAVILGYLAFAFAVLFIFFSAVRGSISLPCSL